MGGTNDPRYNLSFIVQNSVEMDKPMIGISIQYRLSAWGFLGGNEVLKSGATNLGYRDQRLALHCTYVSGATLQIFPNETIANSLLMIGIQENIAAFGGDPSKVTIWGESAGGQSVGAQLLAYNGMRSYLSAQSEHCYLCLSERLNLLTLPAP
jgi:carboxylesterase type B